MRINKLYIYGVIMIVLGYIGLAKFDENFLSFLSAVFLSVGFILVLSSYDKKTK